VAAKEETQEAFIKTAEVDEKILEEHLPVDKKAEDALNQEPAEQENQLDQGKEENLIKPESPNQSL